MTDNVSNTVEEKIRDHFHDDAERFDAIYDDKKGVFARFIDNYWRGVVQKRLKLNVEKLAPFAGKKILDVGCGSGRNSVLFTEAGAKRVVGIDFSQPMIQLAEKFSREHTRETICTFLQADFIEHVFEEKFDVVAALGVLDYIADPVSFLKRMASLANRKVIASFPGVSWPRSPLRKIRYALRGCPLYFYKRPQLARICEQAGFSNYRIVPYASAGFLVIADVNDVPSGCSDLAKRKSDVE